MQISTGQIKRKKTNPNKKVENNSNHKNALNDLRNLPKTKTNWANRKK